jgi:hypothetical protein
MGCLCWSGCGGGDDDPQQVPALRPKCHANAELVGPWAMVGYIGVISSPLFGHAVASPAAATHSIRS